MSCIRKIERQLATLRRIAAGGQRQFNADAACGKILRAVARHYTLEDWMLTGSSRRVEICWPRHVAMYACHKLVGASQGTIASTFHRFDHGTVLNALQRVQQRMESEPSAQAEVQAALDAARKP
jgi:chromosomal replication initiator protein